MTFGVEEEFLLVDAVHGRPMPVATPVLEHAVAHAEEPAGDGSGGAGAPAGSERSGGSADGAEGARAAGKGGRGSSDGCETRLITDGERRVDGRHDGGTEYKHEMLTSQVEAVTGVCTDRSALAHQLLRGRRALAAGAAHAGALLLSCALPPLDSARIPTAGEPRYWRIAEHYAAAMTDYQANGCHVHVGVPDRESAVAVVNHLRPWLPTLLALSANSPYRAGRDTGYASWRIMEQGPFPGSGIPPYFTSAARWESEVARLVELGALADGRLTFWLARPSGQYPTVEFRVCDASATAAEAVLQATLARALVRTALAALRDGRLALPVDGQVAAGALWSAARYGLRGPAVDPWRAVRVPASLMVSALLDEVRPALEETGDLEFVSRRTAWLTGRGSGADRQRAAVRAAGRFSAVVGHLADETLQPPEDLPVRPGGRSMGRQQPDFGDLPPGLPRAQPPRPGGPVRPGGPAPSAAGGAPASWLAAGTTRSERPEVGRVAPETPGFSGSSAPHRGGPL